MLRVNVALTHRPPLLSRADISADKVLTASQAVLVVSAAVGSVGVVHHSK
jgi:hypothetical protein